MDTRNRSPGEKSMLPADILFAILTDQDDQAEQILDWYDRYIRVASYLQPCTLKNMPFRHHGSTPYNALRIRPCAALLRGILYAFV